VPKTEQAPWTCVVRSTSFFNTSPWCNRVLWQRTFKSLFWARVRTKLAAMYQDYFIVPLVGGYVGVEWEISRPKEHNPAA
jgi:hypothetical protein